MAFPSVLTGRHKIPGYIHNRIADLACAADAFETTHVVEYHAKSARRSSRIVGGIPESSPGHRGRSRTFRTIKRCPPGPNHDLAEPSVAVSAGAYENERPRRPSSAPDQPAGSFAAKTSTISILGVSANNRGASAIRVRAMSPARCAWRAASPANASNIANA